MKRWMFVFVTFVMLVAAVPVAAGNGNGSPTGPHYNLNIIGVPRDKEADMEGNNGHRIFVPDYGNVKIYLEPGDPGEFAVLDANGTDQDGASFMLPVPADCACIVDPETGDVVCPDVCTVRYTVWIRLVGTPGGGMDMYTCVEDPDLQGGYLCSDPEWWVDLTRNRGRSTFTNVSSELLFLSADVDADGRLEHVGLFDALFDQYYWQYDNQGVKNAQLRFYMGDYQVEW